MQSTTEVRDVSGIALPPRVRWGRKLIVCPHCHRATPSTEAWFGGRWQAFMPYPCDCEGYRATALVGTVKEGCGVYLHGGNGTGKTTAAWAVASALASEGWRVEITTLAQIKSDLHDTYSTAETQQALFGRLTRCDLLVLDDVGKEVPSEATGELLYRIVNDRYERRRNVVITSNFSRGELASRLAQGCDQSTAKAIASRLAEMTVSIEMDGPDGRRAA